MIEDANLAWAVELRAEGLALLADTAAAEAEAETTRTGTRDFRYLPSTTLPEHWHPYQRVRAGDPDPAGGGAPDGPGAGDGRSGIWRQAVLADLTAPYPAPSRTGLPSDWRASGAGLGRGHELAADAIPSNGARSAAGHAGPRHGRPAGAMGRTQRRARSRSAPSHLRFDVFAEAPKDD